MEFCLCPSSAVTPNCWYILAYLTGRRVGAPVRGRDRRRLQCQRIGSANIDRNVTTVLVQNFRAPHLHTIDKDGETGSALWIFARTRSASALTDARQVLSDYASASLER